MTTDFKKKIEELEKSIQNLISSHQEIKSENSRLREEVANGVVALQEEKLKTKRLEEGYKELKQQERSQRNKNIETIKMKINSLVGEIDKNVALINAKK
jgi:hypothetical protein